MSSLPHHQSGSRGMDQSVGTETHTLWPNPLLIEFKVGLVRIMHTGTLLSPRILLLHSQL